MPLPKDAAIFVTGHNGLVGSAIVRCLEKSGFTNILRETRSQLNLTDPHAVEEWFRVKRPSYVIQAAGKVGGILANSREPAEFLHENLMIQAAVLRAAWKYEVRKLLYLGSSCIYPRDCPQPIREDYLLTGPLEPTNEGYAIAKIAGVKACEAYRKQYGCDFISAMPTNMYGPNDNFSHESSHVLPALLRRFHDAKSQRLNKVTIWGSGTPRREFLHVDDLAAACLFLLENYCESSTINVGTGIDISIHELAATIRDVVYPTCELEFDRSKPDGTPRKLLDVGRLHTLGWKHSIELRDGIAATYDWFLTNQGNRRGVDEE